ncbi:MAG: hypothetical protein P1P72_10460 [ANME-2 cluster archaeon]|nr:hypothetical protein [ANME-2 cluster archaeon]
MEPQKSIISTTGPVRQKTYSSILQILNSVIFSKKYADILITRQFKSEYFSSSEKAAAVITNSVALLAKDTKHSGFVKRTVEAIIRNKDTVMFPDRGQAPLDYIATYHLHPLWIVEKWARELPGAEDVEALCQANDIEPPLTIRVNPLKTDLSSLKASLEKMVMPHQSHRFHLLA